MGARQDRADPRPRLSAVRAARLADAAAIARVHVAAWLETYPGLLPAELIASYTFELRERQWRARLGDATFAREDDESVPPVAYVALDGEEIVGFAVGGPNRGEPRTFPGELFALYLLQRVQGRGVGHALFVRLRDTLRTRGLTPFVLWVVESNPACAFYEREGGRHFTTQPAEVHDVHFIERGYAFDEPVRGE